jgi:hypothetical protein
MKIVRQLKLPIWDYNTAQVVIAYLQIRRFLDAQVSSELIVIGSRGNWIGNLTSFDMTKLITKVKISSCTVGTIVVELDVNTFGQQITEWNAAVWRLEMVELHRVICGLSHIDNVWKRFGRDSRLSYVKWAFTLMICGQSLPEIWESEISRLENFQPIEY